MDNSLCHYIERASAKRALKDSYKSLKKEYRADKGRELYASGKTIYDNSAKSGRRWGGLILAETAANAAIMKGMLSQKAVIAAHVINAGAIATASALEVKERRDNKYLRACYAHRH